MSSSSGSGYGCCLDPRVIDHMTWSVNGAVSARILAPSRARAEAGLAQGAIRPQDGLVLKATWRRIRGS